LKPFVKYLLIALAVVVLDQAVKLVVKFNMGMNQEIHVLGNFFKIHFIENPGAAFGLTISGLFENVMHVNETTGKLILTVFSLLLAGLIGYFLYTVSTYPTKLPFFTALILGGAIGNIIDRVFYGVWFTGMNDYEGGLLHGRVVDMFYLDIWKGTLPEWLPLWGGNYYELWPIFNIADSAISIGIVAVLLFQKRFFAHPAPAAPVAPEAQPTAPAEPA
jgi:signal peptidase II